MFLIVALFLLDFLLLWALAFMKRSWWSPIVLMAILVSVLNFMVVGAWNSGSGWPHNGINPNAQYQFLACDVVPSSAIYLLMVPPSQNPRIGYRSPPQSPRLFKVPFTAQLAEECQKAEKAGQQGQQMFLKAKKSKGKPGQVNNNKHMKLEFYKNPGGNFPPKP